MADTSNTGLGSDNMDEQKKREIQSEGGKASKGGQASDRNENGSQKDQA